MSPTLYQSGILFVGDYNKKGSVFSAFLEMINTKPSEIILIDDRLSNLEEMKATAETLNIDFIGIHYTASDHSKLIYPSDK